MSRRPRCRKCYDAELETVGHATFECPNCGAIVSADALDWL